MLVLIAVLEAIPWHVVVFHPSEGDQSHFAAQGNSRESQVDHMLCKTK